MFHAGYCERHIISPITTKLSVKRGPLLTQNKVLVRHAYGPYSLPETVLCSALFDFIVQYPEYLFLMEKEINDARGSEVAEIHMQLDAQLLLQYHHELGHIFLQTPLEFNRLMSIVATTAANFLWGNDIISSESDILEKSNMCVAVCASPIDIPFQESKLSNIDVAFPFIAILGIIIGISTEGTYVHSKKMCCTCCNTSHFNFW